MQTERLPDGSLGKSVDRKPTQTSLDLHSQSHHHTAQKVCVMFTLIHRAHCVADAYRLPEELKNSRSTFLQNGYSKYEVEHSF